MYSLHVHYEIYDQVSNTDKVQGVPINMGIQWRIRYRLFK